MRSPVRARLTPLEPEDAFKREASFGSILLTDAFHRRVKVSDALLLGGVAVAVVTVIALTAPTATLGPMIEIARSSPIPETDVVIGDVIVHRGEKTHAAIILYTQAESSAQTLLADIERYRNETTDATPPQVREQVCGAQGAMCDNRTGQEKLFADLDRLFRDAAQAARVEGDSTTTAMVDSSDGLLLIAAGTFSRPPDLSAGVSEIEANIEDACLANGIAPATCRLRYHRFELNVNENWSLLANTGPVPPNTSVLGPLNWSVQEIGGDGHASRTRIYLPWGAIVLVAFVVLVLTLSYEYVERRAGNAFLPLTPIAILVGVAALLDISQHPDSPRILARTCSWFGGLLLVYVPIYRLWDASGVQYYSTKIGLTALLAGLVGLVYGFLQAANKPVESLVGILARDGFSDVALDAAAYSLGAIVAVALASLILAIMGSASARLRGLEIVPDEDLGDLIAGKIPPLDPRTVDPEVELSIWARAWGMARRQKPEYWLYDAVGHVPERLWRDDTMKAWKEYQRALRRGRA